LADILRQLGNIFFVSFVSFVRIDMKKLLMLVLTVMINPGTHFNMDLMDRKAEVKRIIEEVINSMSDDEDGDNNSEDEAEGNGKADN
jgi:hypothetical protein